jgi:hypothetical protein
MTPRERIRALLALAHQNDKEHERRAAWMKACSLMDKHGMSCGDFDEFAQRWCIDLTLLFGGGPQRREAGYSYQHQDAHTGPKAAGHQAPRDRTHVRQGDVERDVPDKRWTARTCEHCGARFGYESYPGNPRRYCSETCKEAKVREAAKWRMADRRWRAKQER